MNFVQKSWIIDGLHGRNHDDPRWCALNLDRVGNFDERYGITKQRIQHWKKRIKFGQPLFPSSGGVTALSDNQRTELSNTIIQLRREKIPVGDADLRSLFLKARKITISERGGAKHIVASIEPLCEWTLEKYKDEECLERTAQPLTDARQVALLDPITTITYALMLLAFAGFLPATNKVNFDCSTVEIPDQFKSRKGFIHKRDPEEGPVTSSEVQSALGVLIKLMHIVAASGHKGRTVGVIAVKEMPEGEFFVSEVKSLHNTTDLTTHGFLYASNIRAGNSKM